jgi:hypothetical protein
MPSDRPRRRFEDDDDRDEPEDLRRTGRLPVGLVLLSCGAAVLLLLVVTAAAFRFTVRQNARPPEAVELDAATDARLAADAARVRAEKAAPRVLDQAAWDEVRGAFSDNKVAARDKYKDVRWLLKVRIAQIGDTAVAAIHPVIDQQFDMQFRSLDDVKGLRPNQDREVTGRLAPLDLPFGRIVFEDVTLR